MRLARRAARHREGKDRVEPVGLGDLFNVAAEAEVDHIWTDALNPRPRVWPSVQGFLGRGQPMLGEHYRKSLFDPVCRIEYESELGRRVQAAAAQADLPSRPG
jgi:hypothetical protein